MNHPPTVEKLTLELKQRALVLAFSPEIFVKMPGPATDALAHAWQAGLRARVPYNKLWTYMKPVDWWEAVKDRWAPVWFKKKWPVRLDKVELHELLKMAVPSNVGDRCYVMSFNGREESGLPDGYEEAHTTCPECRKAIFVPFILPELRRQR